MTNTMKEIIKLCGIDPKMLGVNQRYIGHRQTIQKVVNQLDTAILSMVDFIYADSMTVPARQHKRKRIDKKWAKFYRKPDPTIIVWTSSSPNSHG